MTVNGALDHKNTCTASYKRETHARKEQEGKGGGWGLKGRSFGSKVSPAFSSFPSALAHVSSSRPETNGTSQVLEAGELEESLEESANENRLWEYEPQMSVPSLKHSLLH